MTVSAPVSIGLCAASALSLLLVASSASAQPASFTLTEKGQPLYTPDISDQLDVGVEGTISFIAQAKWDNAHCDEQEREFGRDWAPYKFIYANGSANQARFRVALHCDRRQMFFEGGQVQDVLRLPVSFADQKPHHVVLQTDSHGTTIWIDNKAVGAVPVAYAKVRRVPANVGSNANAESPFIGTIKSLRVFKGLVDPVGLNQTRNTPLTRLKSTPEYGALVGYLSVVNGQPQFVIKASTNELTGRWASVDHVNLPQRALPTTHGEQNDFVPQPVVSVEWTERCSALARASKAPKASGAACSQRVLAVMTASLWRDPVVALYQANGSGRFAEIGGRGQVAVKKTGRGTELQINGRRYVRAKRLPADAVFTDSWTKQIENFEVMSMGIHLRDLDLRFAASTPGRIPVFNMLPDQVAKNYRHLSGLAVPFGAHVNFNGVQCKGERFARQMTSGDELLNELEQTYSSVESQEIRAGLAVDVAGAGGGSVDAAWGSSLGLNESLKKMMSNLKESEMSLVRQEARCAGYAFMLDPVRLDLNPAFVDAVNALKVELQQRRPGAVARFIERVGTHYANSVTFGGIASLEVKMSKEATTLAQSLATMLGTSTSEMFRIDASASGTVKGVTVSASGGMTNSSENASADSVRNMSRRLQSLMTTRTRYETRGGIGGANYESWSSGGVQLPVYIQLRPISELLGPPFFTDADVIFDVRKAVQLELQKVLVSVEGAKSPFLSNKLLPKKNWGEACPNFDVDCPAGLTCRSGSGKQKPNGGNMCLKRLGTVAEGQACQHTSECANRKKCGIGNRCGAPSDAFVSPGCRRGMTLKNGQCIGREERRDRNSSRPNCPSGYKFNGSTHCELKARATSYRADCPRGFRNDGKACVAVSAEQIALVAINPNRWKAERCKKAICKVNYALRGCNCQQAQQLPSSVMSCPSGKKLKKKGNVFSCIGGCSSGFRLRGSQCVKPAARSKPTCPPRYVLSGGRCAYKAPSTTNSKKALERNTNRPGRDYGRLRTKRPEDCQQACQKDRRCKAFTWSKGQCWLKNSVPSKRAMSGAVSGVK